MCLEDRQGPTVSQALQTEARATGGAVVAAAKSSCATPILKETCMSPPEQWTHPEPGDGPAAEAAKPSPEQVIAGLRATSEGGPELTQLLTPEGERVDSERFDRYVTDVDDEALRALYRDMVLVRRGDRE